MGCISSKKARSESSPDYSHRRRSSSSSSRRRRNNGRRRSSNASSVVAPSMVGSAVSYGPLEGIKEEPEKEEGLEEEEEVSAVMMERKGAPSSSNRRAARFGFRFGRLTEGEHVAAGWPSWLSAAAGEAIEGWLPLR